MTTSLIRDRYVADSVGTASPARLVTMLYDRLVRDLVAAEAALTTGDPGAVNQALIHAQEITWELAAGLDPSRWSGGPALAALYQFMIDELVAANVTKDPVRVGAVRVLVEPLAEAWHRAADEVAGGGS